MEKAKEKKLLIVEEALKNHRNGHWFEYIKAIADDCRTDGMQVDIAAHQEVSEAVRNELGAIPALSFSMWDGIYQSANPFKRYVGVFNHNFRLFKDVRRFLSVREKYDYVFAPTILVYHLIGWYLVTLWGGGNQFKRLVLLFMNTPGHYDSNGIRVFPRSSQLLKVVIRWFISYQQKGQVVLAVNTERAAEHYRQFCGLNFTVFPQPVLLPIMPERDSQEPITLACYGFARHEKGSDLLQEALTILLQEHPQLHFKIIIQWGADFVDEHNKVVVKSPFLQQHEAVEYLDKALHTAEYAIYLSKTDGIVLPYRRSAYYDRDSRVAIEAAIFGIPMVFTKDTWLNDVVKDYGAGVGFEDGNVIDLKNALYELITQIRTYKKRAKERQQKAREYFSVAGFKQVLLAQ